MNVFKRLDRWIFQFGSPVTLGVYRAIFSGLIFVNLLMVSIDFETWFTEKGLVPAKAASIWSEGIPRLNVLDGVTDPRITLTVYVLTTLAALFTALGLWSRVSSIVLAVGLVSLHHRDPIILHSGDTLMRITAVLFAVAPVGAAFSLDQWIRAKKGHPEVKPVSLWPQRLIQIEMALMYGTTVWHKLTGLHWVDGTAAWYPPQLSEFHRFPLPGWVDLPPFVQLATWGTLIIEFALASLVFWKPARKYCLWGGILLHATIEYRFNIPLFAFLSVAQYLSHYEGAEVSAWLDRWSRRSNHASAPS